MTKDEEVIQLRRRLAPDYKRTDGRHDPFESEALDRLLKGKSDSMLLKRKIVSLNDALDHAEAVVKAWAQEDSDIEELRERQRKEEATRNILNAMPSLPELPKVVIPKGTAAQQARFAKHQWHAAVAWRKQVDKVMAEYVSETNELYKALRGL